MKNPIVTLHVKRHGAIRLELYPEHAPQSVRNFIALVRSGFYDGLAFWRIEKDLLIQTGSSDNGLGSTVGYAIRGEYDGNGFPNPLTFARGTIGFARLLPDSANSQVFIMVSDWPHLNGRYAAFGRVISGIEAVEAIASGPARKDGIVHRALDPDLIDRAEVETFGVDYPAPHKLPEPSPDATQAELERVMASVPKEG